MAIPKDEELVYCVPALTLMSILTSFICATGSSIQSDWSCWHYLHKHRTPENTSQVPQQGPVHFEVWFDRHKSRQLGAKAHRPASSLRVISIPVMISFSICPVVAPFSVFVWHLARIRSMAHLSGVRYCHSATSWSWTVLGVILQLDRQDCCHLSMRTQTLENIIECT